jgi:hypothetical protein
MLRAFGLLVAISIALLLWAIRPSESRSLTRAEAVPAQAPAPTGTATEPRWRDRPVPRLPDVSPASEPGVELEPPLHTDLVDPPDSPDHIVEPGELERPVDPDPLQAVEPATEEAEPDYVPTAADEELLARAGGFLDKFLSAIESNAGNCDGMADALSEFFSSSRDFIAEAREMEDQPARSRWFAAQLEARMSTWAERIAMPLQGCMSNERLMAAMTSFAG